MVSYDGFKLEMLNLCKTRRKCWFDWFYWWQ